MTVTCYSGGKVIYAGAIEDVTVMNTGWRLYEKGGRITWVSGDCVLTDLPQ